MARQALCVTLLIDLCTVYYTFTGVPPFVNILISDSEKNQFSKSTPSWSSVSQMED